MDRNSLPFNLKLQRMKSKIFFLILTFICSCSAQLQEKGQLTLQNGEGKDVKVDYNIYDLPQYTAKYTLEDFKTIATIAANKGKSICKNNLTFEPKQIQLLQNNDTITLYFDMVSKNGFGVPKEKTIYVDFIGTKFIGYDISSLD